ncbi:mannose-1-phosphate guanylyltransferase/mannose-6-phosphate isomerase [Limnohabitans sp. 2KL-1]|uniref:mannose-1-phosphate guanylyltransferase/mannose-6-phosphate isomerase n=1 Tax=Limnohabitans sp. 2KL-1 TaxID=1100699 RepID=UPI000D36FE17|nr:mannose-1-phosphate guanylyltransferase/mannose-6-phosphate isomerase [Limnohabitans sp. 2KL-1]PUE44811.1 mannose-1-phosphate guanylyltransferase/mannose-6-phosphate isomerase [Limnohabitans sp. 2KL-1]
MQLLPVVMAGGSGTRLWPLSREMYPKQFLTLEAGQSMLQSTVGRLQGLDVLKPVVICNENHRFLVAEQLRQMGALQGNILLEPVGRNTAPAVALAALQASRDGADPLLLVLAADHMIQDTAAFQDAVGKALPLAERGALVTFGIVAQRPETGYGYIRRGKPVAEGAYEVAAFVEKPNLAVAESYLSEGGYDWNSGMFLFRASRYLEALKAHRPDVLAACQSAMADARSDMDFVRVDEAVFRACPDVSIDYAVMEKTRDAVLVPMDAGWSDVGAFAALWEVLPQDEQGNVHRGDVLSHDSRNNLVMSENALVATVGLQDTVVVQTKDAVFVAPRSRASEVKQIVDQLKRAGRTEHQLHREVFRPWGKYDSVDASSRYQVKRITVKPGARLSVQMHHHRAEHWIVVSGTANVTLDGVQHLLTENQSIYLPVGAVHALENPGKIPLELIEVQVGSYLGEDDIVRFEDLYGRT